MAFNETAFMKQKFEPRTDQVKVPELKNWFDKGEKPIWVVRGLTSEESARCNEGIKRQETLSALIEAIGTSQLNVDEIKQKLGLNDKEMPDETILMIERILVGSMTDGCEQIDRSIVVKISISYPSVFYRLSSRIMELTALGMEANIKKPRASGKT